MSPRLIVGNSTVRIARVFSVGLLALLVGWVAMAMYMGGRLAADLIAAASDGDADAVEALLARGADVNARGQRGQTALMQASWNGQPDAVQALLGAGADLNAKSDRGSIDWGQTALMEAAAKGHLAAVRALLAGGADVNARDKDGVTALMQAVRNRHPDVVQAGAPGQGGRALMPRITAAKRR